ncbi:unnamed protein product [Cunninghamella echinulata]
MTFEKELYSKVYEPWRYYYVQYEELMAEMKRKLASQNNQWNNSDEEEFMNLFQRELSKVYNFINDSMIEINKRIDRMETKLNGLKTLQQQQNNDNSNSSEELKSAYDNISDIVAELLFDINDLSKFHQLNLTALTTLTEQHDLFTRMNFHITFNDTLLKTWPLDKLQFDVMIVRLSNMQDLCRLYGHPRSKNAYSQGEDQTAFERATAKYWIHPDNITEVKSIILMYLPIHVFNQKKAFEQEDAAVSSVYFDNKNFDLYSERLERSEGAEAIRFRWYGQAVNDIYIERKTHHAPWLNGTSVKDRVRLKDSLINPFIQGSYTADDLVLDLKAKGKLKQDTIEQNAFIARGVQDSFQHRHLQPMCRVFYNRTAFQLPGDQRLRLSLDTNLTFIREDHMDGKKRRTTGQDGQESWRRLDINTDYPFRQIPQNDIHRFPYAVLETKIQSHLGQEAPPWLTSLLNSHLVHEVPRFSKYIHGASQLYKKSIPVLPWWVNELNKDIRRAPISNIGLSRSLSFKPLFNGHHRRSLTMNEDPFNQQQHQKSQPTHLASKSLPYIAIKLSDTSGNDNNSNNHTNEKVYHRNQNVDGGKNDFMTRFWKGTGLQNTKKNIDDWKLPLSSSKKQQQSQPTPRILGQYKKMDPKAFFANERTFISWLQFCALILTVALNLLNYGDHISRMVGAFFIILASIISFYALFRFQIRAYQMRTGKNILRMDDIYGPIVLCVLLVTALLINFYLRAPLLSQSDSNIQDINTPDTPIS